MQGFAFPLVELHELSAEFSSLPRSLWTAAHPSGASATHPSSVPPLNLLKAHSVPSSRSLMRTLNSAGLSTDPWDTSGLDFFVTLSPQHLQAAVRAGLSILFWDWKANSSTKSHHDPFLSSSYFWLWGECTNSASASPKLYFATIKSGTVSCQTSWRFFGGKVVGFCGFGVLKPQLIFSCQINYLGLFHRHSWPQPLLKFNTFFYHRPLIFI